MRTKISSAEYEKVESLIYDAIDASNKKEAQEYLKQIGYVVLGLDGNACNIISKCKSLALAASGRSKDKSSMIYFCKSELTLLKRYVDDSV